jgi:hypothetical protein
VHFFPEGELKPYDTSLRDFKQGAFHLAAPGLGARGAAVDPSRPADRSALNAARTPTMVLVIGEQLFQR